MKVDCRWFSANLESYFCEKLTDEEARLAREHADTCTTCHREIQALQDIDPLVKQVFALRLSLATAPQRMSGFRIALASALVAAIAVVGFVLQTPIAPPAVTPVVKVEEPASAVRAKPDPDIARPEVRPTVEIPAPNTGPAFSVIDQAGYSTSLEDYQGYVLLFGVWSADQPQSAQNLERLYDVFGANTRIRVLGVSADGNDRIAGTTFPLVFNNRSQLLGAAAGEFVLMDAEGKERMRGSLLADTNTLVSQIQNELGEVGILK